MRTIINLTLFLLLASVNVNATVYYVSKTGDNSTGTSWAKAKTSLSGAESAASAGDEVWVRSDTYDELLTISKDLDFYGGFAGTESARAERNPATNVTKIIRASGRAVLVNNSISGVVVDGFTLTGVTTNSHGSGVYIGTSGGGTFNDCLFDTCTGTNSDSYYGGGLYVASGTWSITNCEFVDCFGGLGGGIYVANGTITVDECEFTDNSARFGGGFYVAAGTLTLTDSDFDGNDATVYHGGNAQVFGGTLNASRCKFMNGVAASRCGGLVFLNGTSNTLTNCLISGNGGAAYANGIFVHAYTAHCTVVATNCTIVDNETDYPGVYLLTASGYTATFTGKNNVHYNPGATEIGGEGAGTETIGITYSGVIGGYTGTGNINLNAATNPPLFVGGAGSDPYDIRKDSPMVNTGTNTGAPADDVLGRGRPYQTTTDMGAYEIQEDYATSTPSPTNTATNTPTATNTNTATNTATETRTNTPTNTATNTPTATNTATNTRTNTATNTATSTRTNTATNTPTNTATHTPTPTVYCGGDGSEGNPYQICDAARWYYLSNTSADWSGKYFLLTADITISGVTQTIGTSATKFTGQFDGNKHTVSDGDLDQDVDYTGLFGYIASGAEIKDVTFSGCDVKGKRYSGLVGTVGAGSGDYGTLTGIVATGCTLQTYYTGNTQIGMLAGRVNEGLLENCQVANSAITTDTAVAYIGGLVGYGAKVTLRQCSITDTTITAETGISYWAGGIIGVVAAPYDTYSVYQCRSGATMNVRYRSGGVAGESISGAIISQSVFDGVINASDTQEVGGIVGDHRAQVSNCYNRGTIAVDGMGASGIGGVVGRMYSTDASPGRCEYAYSSASLPSVSDVMVSHIIGSFGGTPTPYGYRNYADDEVNATVSQTNSEATVGDVTYATTLQMKSKSTYTGWDDTVWTWDSCKNDGYPVLLWEVTQTPGWEGTCTPTNTPTNTPTHTATHTATDTSTDTATVTDTPTSTATNTDTDTPTVTNTAADTPTASNTPTSSNTNTQTDTPTVTNTFTRTMTYTPTRTFTKTVTETYTPTVTKTYTRTRIPTLTPTHTLSQTFTRTATISYTPIDTRTPTLTKTPTQTTTPYTPTVTGTPHTPTLTPTIWVFCCDEYEDCFYITEGATRESDNAWILSATSPQVIPYTCLYMQLGPCWLNGNIWIGPEISEEVNNAFK